MELRQIVNKMGTLTSIIIENVTFQKDEIAKYETIFKNLKELNIIEKGSFYDPTWYTFGVITNSIIPLRFEMDMYPELQTVIRCFTVSQLAMNKATSTVATTLEALRKIIFETNGFNIKKLEEMLSELEATHPATAYRYSRHIINLLSFYPLPNAQEIIDRCYSISRVHHNNRELPDLEDIIEFDRIINDYFRRVEIEEHLPYKPIQIFWTITNIIPTRPSEFLLLKMDCLVEANGKYQIVIPRIKNDDNEIYNQTIQITEDIYYFIQEFILRQKQLGIDSDYLFSLQFHELSYQSSWPKKDMTDSSSYQDRITATQFNNLLKRFYNRVVKGMYNETFPTQIVPMHTRHFAIINMFLQGFNMLSIARMAGHLDLKTQENYYSHAKTFAQSHVYNLLRTGMGESIGTTMPDGIFGWRQNVKNRSARFKRCSHDELNQKYRKTIYGYCKDENYPYNCSEDCRVCLPHYIFMPTIDEQRKAGKWLESYSEQMEQAINSTVELMIETSKSLTKLFNPVTEAAFNKASSQLQKYMDHKLMVDLKIKEGEQHGKETEVYR